MKSDKYETEMKIGSNYYNTQHNVTLKKNG